MTAAPSDFTAVVRQEGDGSYWAEVLELPGCFASGFDLDELKEALTEAIGLCLPDSAARGERTRIRLSALRLERADVPGL